MKKLLLTVAALAAIGLVGASAANAGTLGTLSSSSEASAAGGTGGFMGPFGFMLGGNATAGDESYGNASLNMSQHGVTTGTASGSQGYGYSNWAGFTTFGGAGMGNANASVMRGFVGFPGF